MELICEAPDGQLGQGWGRAGGHGAQQLLLAPREPARLCSLCVFYFTQPRLRMSTIHGASLAVNRRRLCRGEPSPRARVPEGRWGPEFRASCYPILACPAPLWASASAPATGSVGLPQLRGPPAALRPSRTAVTGCGQSTAGGSQGAWWQSTETKADQQQQWGLYWKDVR